MAALACIRGPQHQIDLFGFNWSDKSYYMHKMTSEAAIFGELIRQYNITVHQPACDALYSCDPQCDESAYRLSMHSTGEECYAQVWLQP